jgi:predicted DNA binding CopG/RHH family protein
LRLAQSCPGANTNCLTEHRRKNIDQQPSATASRKFGIQMKVKMKKDKVLNLRIAQTDKDRIKQKAKDQGISISSLVLQSIRGSE